MINLDGQAARNEDRCTEKANDAKACEVKPASADEGFVLPVWAVNMFLRTSLGGLSRIVWRLSLHGTEHIPPVENGGLLIAANHQTYFDPFWVSVPIRRALRYLAWDAAFDWFLVGRIIPVLGAIPLALEGGDRPAVRRALDHLRAGSAVMIFPEGGRGNPDGTLARFKPGAVRLALEANVPILPVTISGAHRVWNRTQLMPHTARVKVTYHPIHNVRVLPGEDARHCARRESDALAQTIASAL